MKKELIVLIVCMSITAASYIFEAHEVNAIQAERTQQFWNDI
jgi:hypothetical protein